VIQVPNGASHAGVTLQSHREPREDDLRDVLCGMLVVDDRAHVSEDHARVTQVQGASASSSPSRARSTALRPLPRLRGLLGRCELPAGEGLRLRPSPSIHTWLMPFPIDVVFLDKELRVLAVRRGLGPMARGDAAGSTRRPRTGRRRGTGAGDPPRLAAATRPDRSRR